MQTSALENRQSPLGGVKRPLAALRTTRIYECSRIVRRLVDEMSKWCVERTLRLLPRGVDCAANIRRTTPRD